MKSKGKFEIEFTDEKNAAAAETAISHEGNGSKRSAAKIKRSGKRIEIELAAADVVAFRAMLNTLLRDFQAIEGQEEL